MARRGRPYGEITLALLAAAAQPGTVRELATRSQVGFDAARYKAKDLVRAGALVPFNDARPRVLTLPRKDEAPDLAFVLKSWWQSGQ